MGVDEVIERHQRACDGFAAVADKVTRWDAPSPCAEWDARAVVEHVIGFHEVLVLRPLEVKASRPRDDAAARWRATEEAIVEAISRPGVLDADDGKLRGLVSILSTDVLVHTWDLAKADGQDVQLDPELCQLGYDRAAQSRDQFAQSDMFDAEVKVSDDADACSKLLGIMGRDPSWKPPA